MNIEFLSALRLMPTIYLLITVLYKLFTYLLTSVLIYIIKNDLVPFPGRRF